MEYDFAVEEEIPILGFVRDQVENIPAKYTERSHEGMEKLAAFRAKIQQRTC